MTGKTLIAYASKSGATAESARIIAEVLRQDYGLEVDVLDLGEEKKPDISGYDNVVIGSGVRIGMWYGRARGMMRGDFTGKKVAVYISSMRAGNPEEYEKARQNYLEKRIGRWLNVKPVAAEAFGGWYKKQGRTGQSNHDPVKVREWAKSLGQTLRS